MIKQGKNQGKNFAQKMINGATLYYFGILSSRIIGLLSTLSLLYFLDKTQFGIAAILLAIWIFARSITIADSDNLVIIYRGKNPDYIDTVATQWLIMACFHALLIFAFSGVLMDIFPQIPSKKPFYILSLTCIVAGLVHPGFALFQKELKFGPSFWVEILAKLGAVTISILIAVIYKSFYAIIFGQLTEFTIRALYAGFTYGFRWRFSFAAYKEIKNYSLWYFLMSVVVSLSLQLEILLLPIFVGLSEIGSFYIARRISKMVIADIARAISEAVFSGFIKVNHQKKLLRSVYLRVVESYGIIILPIGFGLALCAHEFTLVFFDGKWATSGWLIAIMGPILALHAITASTQALVMAAGKFYTIFWRELFVLILKVILIMVLGHLYGFNGAMFAIIIAWPVQMLLSIFIYKEVSQGKMLDYYHAIKRSLLASILMFGILSLFKYFCKDYVSLSNMLFLVIFLGIITYILLIYLLWVVDRKPKKSIERIILHQLKLFKYKRMIARKNRFI